MSAIETLLRQPAAEAIGWALLHFVWQGILVAGIAASVLGLLRKNAADVRYVVATIALSLMFTLPAATALRMWQPASETAALQPTSPEAPAPPAKTPPDSGAAATVNAALGFVSSTPAVRLDAWLPAIVLTWLCGVLLLSLRLASGWLWVQRLKTHGTTPTRDAWQVIAARLSRRLHIGRAVTLLESTLVDVPTVIGWLRPVMLLPVSALSGLTPRQLEAILAHELAHIRRHDYFVNLLQTLVETLLFYHPAVWWVSKRIRIERENCCDDLAVSLCGDPLVYAEALADLEERRGARPAFVMAATGGSLVQRVRRLLGAPAHEGRAPGWLAASVSLVLMLGIGISAVRTDASATLSGDLRAMPASPQAPSLPARPVPPTSPAPPTEPAFAAALGSASQRHGTFTYQNNNEKLEIRYDGDVEFTDDDTDVRRMSPGGMLRIKDGGFLSGLFTGRTIEFAADPAGNITRRYWVGTSERPFEPEGRQWLAKVLPRFIRQTGIGAEARAARILKAKGAAGVLAEISQIEGSWAKRVYFRELLKTPLDAATARQALVQVGREIDSDYELASLLIDGADKLLVDEAARQAYFEAARSIQSDYEMRRVYSTALKRGAVNPALLASILQASRDIDSDYEEASLLVQIAQLQPLDNTTRGPFFDALATVSSDYERRRVLSAVADRAEPAADTTAAMLASAGNITSDYELASFLLQIVKRQPIEGALRAPFFRAVDSLDSGYERGRVLQAVAKRSDASAETVVALLRATAGVKSSHEASTVLLTVASMHPISGPARDAYIEVAEKLGDYEQGRALSALLRNERR